MNLAKYKDQLNQLKLQLFDSQDKKNFTTLTARKLGCDDEKSIEVTALIRVNILSGCYSY